MKKIFFILLFAFCGTLSADCIENCPSNCVNSTNPDACEKDCQTSCPMKDLCFKKCMEENHDNPNAQSLCTQRCYVENSTLGNPDPACKTRCENEFQDPVEKQGCTNQCPVEQMKTTQPIQNSYGTQTNANCPCEKTPTTINN